jgi:hypothetical protein
MLKTLKFSGTLDASNMRATIQTLVCVKLLATCFGTGYDPISKLPHKRAASFLEQLGARTADDTTPNAPLGHGVVSSAFLFNLIHARIKKSNRPGKDGWKWYGRH